jgi:hypothetical protein
LTLLVLLLHATWSGGNKLAVICLNNFDPKTGW